jgi:hypothetical protein
MSNNWIDLKISRGPIRGKDRNRIGVTLHAKALPEFEEYMKTLSNNQKMPSAAYGDTWLNVADPDKPLELYNGDFTPNHNYNLIAISGQPLLIRDDPNNPRGALARLQNANMTGDPDLPNLSFLRTVGISEGEGIAIGFAGAYSWDYINRMRTLYPLALKQFLHDYIVPITINLHVMVK